MNNLTNRILVIVLLMFLGLNGYLIFSKYKSEKIINDTLSLVTTKERQIKNLKNDIKKFVDNMLTQFENDEFDVTESLIHKTKLGDYNYLVFRFHEDNCMPCVNSQLRLLKKYANQNIIERKILIFAGLNNKHELERFIKEVYPISVLSIEPGQLPIDNSMDPYFFILDKKNKMRRVFIPNPLDSSLTISYLNLNSKILNYN